MDYRQAYNRRETPQREAVPGREAEQVENREGGYVFEADLWTRLRRFLVLGTEGGTYYVDEKKLTRQAGETVSRCLEEDALRTIEEIRQVSVAGRAPKNDPAVFALALAASSDCRAEALAALPDVCRTAPHLFLFADCLKGLRGWGAGLRKAVANWYEGKEADRLAYQIAKYPGRRIAGRRWEHRDLLRLSHPPGRTGAHEALYALLRAGSTHDLEESFAPRTVERKTAVGISERQYAEASLSKLHAIAYEAMRLRELDAVESWSVAEDREVVRSIREHGLTHEMIPSRAKRSAEVWEALLEKMPASALVWNLGRMTSLGVLGPLNDGTRTALGKLDDRDWLRRSRVHPVKLLVALKAYAVGHSLEAEKQGREPLRWTPDSQVLDALDVAFYESFEHVEPLGKRVVLALDVSASMRSRVSGFPLLTSSEVSAAFAMLFLRRDLATTVVVGFNNGLVPLGLSPRMRLDDVARRVSDLTAQGTDCSLPARFAQEKEIRGLEAILILTDNQTWAGSVHPYQALEAYRRWSGVTTRQVVLATDGDRFSIADPKDPLSLDVSGFDTSVPELVSDFLRGRV